MTRTPLEIAQHHGSAVAAGDIDDVLADYTDESVMITPHGTFRGRDGARQAWGRLFEDMPNAKLDTTGQTAEGEVLLLHWAAETDKGRVTDGVDTFVFGDDGIRVQTVHYTRPDQGSGGGPSQGGSRSLSPVSAVLRSG
jgi:hypothetical protein